MAGNSIKDYAHTHTHKSNGRVDKAMDFILEVSTTAGKIKNSW